MTAWRVASLPSRDFGLPALWVMALFLSSAFLSCSFLSSSAALLLRSLCIEGSKRESVSRLFKTCSREEMHTQERKRKKLICFFLSSWSLWMSFTRHCHHRKKSNLWLQSACRQSGFLQSLFKMLVSSIFLVVLDFLLSRKLEGERWAQQQVIWPETVNSTSKKKGWLKWIESNE